MSSRAQRGIYFVALLTLPAFAQMAPMPRTPSPQVPVDPAMAQSLAVQQEAFRAYQGCVAANHPAVDLHNASRQIVQFRDHPGMLEGALQGPDGQARAPNGAAGVMADLFAHYRSFGGTAATIADVTETPTPCPPPQMPARSPPPDGRNSIQRVESTKPTGGQR